MTKKEDEIIEVGLDLYELAMAGKLKYKAPRRKSQQNLEHKVLFGMMKLVREKLHTPHKAQLQFSKTEELLELYRKDKKIPATDNPKHWASEKLFKYCKNMWDKYMRKGGIYSSLKRNKKGRPKDKKKNS
ncbi:hypothetical protein SAR11G3_00983 [Candidatus Pelagibacter sp. IMCC9063]|uniref:hypothetical protein n=1 Tax=Pelagibacter sp. (strain IMCC9063) TaxID=1002672 RepID=UPI0002046726|nr:hypothetical protein [Candidatus Pelagibacter sp. IMCC9063]AEA81458.1 hypothetical protein SAR11G3_00983 [Candidatus Pelagibacter sp. IMCC9063]